MRIGFCSDDFIDNGEYLFPGGCGYYRCLLPKNAAGPHAAFGPPAFAAQLGFGVRDKKDTARFGFDAVMLKMMMHRWVPMQIDMAHELTGQQIIVDIDDHYDGMHDANIAKKYTDPETNPLRNRDIYRQVAAAADVITVSTPFLQDYYQQLGMPDVRLIRNGINPQQFNKHKHTSRKPVIGWAGAMKWRSNDAEILRPWLGQFLEQHDLMFHHAGHMEDAPTFAEVAGIDPARVTMTGMQPVTRYASLLTFDIGIVPLSMIDFNFAKSTIKGLEYAAANIPFVASATPEYARLAGLGVGRVADSPQQWLEHLEALLDYKTRKHEAARQRTLALEEHSIVARAPEWAALFSELTAQPTSIPSVRLPYVAA